MKALSLYQPVTIEKALGDFNRYMESVFGDSPLSPGFNVRNGGPAVDIRETGDAFILEAELPGYDEGAIEVEVEGGVVIIGSRQETPVEAEEKTGEHYLLRERPRASFRRTFKLPENADLEAVSASFKNGLLTLEIKKRAEARKRVISIGK